MVGQPTAHVSGRCPGGGWGRSVLAGAAGIGLCGGLVALGYYVLPQFSYWLAVFFAIGAGGGAIGLIDRRRPYVTVVAASAVAALAHLGYLLATASQGGPADWVGSAVVALFFGGLIALVAAAGVSVAAGLYRAHGARRCWAWGALALVFLGVFILPWARLQQRSRAFMTHREGDVRNFLDDKIVAVPETALLWRVRPSRDLIHGLRGAGFTTTWEALTQTAGRGRCALLFEVRRLSPDTPMGRIFNRARLSFTPDSPTNEETVETARSVFQELGLKLRLENLDRVPREEWLPNDVRWDSATVRTAGVSWPASVEFSVSGSGEVIGDVLRSWDR